MKGLSLTPPWGTLIAVAARFPELGKRIETRGWRTDYRSELAIHQAKGLGEFTERELAALCEREPFRLALAAVGITDVAQLPRGQVVAVAEIADCVPTRTLVAVPEIGRFTTEGSPRIWSLTDRERAFGDYEPGRFGWLLADVAALAAPVTLRGSLGLWEVPADVEAQIRAQLAPATP